MEAIYKHGFFQALAQDKAMQQLFKAHRDLGLPEGNTKNLHAAISKNVEDRRVADLSIAKVQAKDHEEKRKLLLALLANKANPLAIPVLASSTMILREIGLSSGSISTVFDKQFEGKIKFDADARFEDTEDHPVLMVRGRASKDGTTYLSCTGHPEEEEAQRTAAQSDDDDDILTIIVRPGGGGAWNWLKNAFGRIFGGGGGSKEPPMDAITAAFMDILGATYEGAQVGAFVTGTGFGFGGMIIGGVIGSPAGPAGAAEGGAIGATVGAVYGGAQGAVVGGLSAGAWRTGEIIFQQGTNVVEFPNGQSDSEATMPDIGFPGLGGRQTSTRDPVLA